MKRPPFVEQASILNSKFGVVVKKDLSDNSRVNEISVLFNERLED